MRKAQIELDHIKSLAREFYFKGTEEIAVLLVHGFTASPSEMFPLGKFLHENKFTVLGVQLAGHGTECQHMLKYRWQDWYNSVERAFNRLKSEYDKIIPIGISMGALLSLYLIEKQNHNKIPGLILLAPPFKLKSRLVYLSPILKFFIKFNYKGDDSLQYFKDHNLYSYLNRPISSLAEFLALQRYINRNIKGLTLPTLIAFGSNDNMISKKELPNAVRRMFLKPESVQITELKQSGHILTVEPDANELFQIIENFLRLFR